MEKIDLSEIKQNSIELKRNAKGDYGWDIKIYFNDESEEKVIERVEKLDKAIKEKYQNV